MRYSRKILSPIDACNILIVLELIGHTAVAGTRIHNEDSITKHYSYNGKFYEVTKKRNSDMVPIVTEITIINEG